MKIPNRTCKQCNKEFYAMPSVIKKTNGAFYCSKNCRIASTVGRGPSNWKGGKILRQGYVCLWDKELQWYVFEHRKIIEDSIGRKLTRREVVHHKNGDRTDNRIENLEIFTPNQHTKLHYPKLYEAAQKARQTIIKHWSLKYGEYCYKCKTTKFKHASHGLCNSCYMKQYHILHPST